MTDFNTPNPVTPLESQPTPPSPGASQPPLPQMPEPGWIAKNKKMLLRLIIVLVILAGAALYARYQNPATEPGEEAAVSNALEQEAAKQKGPEIKVTDNTPAAESPAVTVKTEDGSITVTARRGQGYTHLAREAIAEYLKTGGGAGLTAEHKIYIEDYLQKHLANRSGLNPGDQVTFLESNINDAVSSAQSLTERQLKNLQKYVPLVPGL